MSNIDQDISSKFKVLINIEQQYAFWPAFKAEIPYGWKETGIIGTKDECAKYVKEVWTDMRPLSLRKIESNSTA